MPSIHRIARHEFDIAGRTGQFRVVGFEGVEHISRPYRFVVELVSDDPDIDFASAINQAATLTMYRGDDPSEVDGVVVDFEQSHEAGGQSEFRYAYRAVLVPRLWRLSLSFQSRIYQHLNIQEIVSDILDEAEVEHEWQLSETYEPREYTTQYKETDLDFVQRLLEYEGIWYYFTHEEGRDTVVFCDDASSTPVMAGDASVPYSHADGLRPDDSLETIRDFIARQRLVTGKTELKDYNYRTPETELLSESEIDGGLVAGKSSDSMTHVDAPARSDRLAVVRNEEIEATRLVMTGAGDCLRFRAGYRFDLRDHYRDGLNQTYLLTSVTHTGRQPDATEAQSAEEVLPGYSNRFTCLPASAPYRPPRRTPEPKLPGVLTAKVESAGGTYAPVDDQGRYRIRFPFDLGDAGDAQATKPVRLAQPYSGPGYGQHFPVHKDVEMVVACVDGNVDRILGISTVYNPTQNSPVTSDNPSDNILRSWGANELTFRDEQGSEEVFMNATKDHTVAVANNQSISVGADRSQSVGNDVTLSVGNDQTETVGNDLELTVENDRTETIGNDETTTIGNDRTTTIGANETVEISVNRETTIGLNDETTVQGNQELAVQLNQETTVGLNQELSVGVMQEISVGGNRTLSVDLNSEETVNGTRGVTSNGEMSFGSPSKITLNSFSEIELVVGANSIKLDLMGITINGVKVSSTGQITNEMSAATVKVAGTAMTEITGGMVKIN